MSAARIDVVDRLNFMAEQARAAGNQEASAALATGAKMIESRLAHVAAQETMRDRAAFAALTGLLASNPNWAIEGVVEEAYHVADHVMKVRAK